MRLPPEAARAVTAEEMARIDRAAIDWRRIPSLKLMERAGSEATRVLIDWWRAVGPSLIGSEPPASGARGARRPAQRRSGARIPAPRRGGVPLGPVLVLCGRGNNGGDGFVVARRLKTAGWVVRALVAAAEGDLSPDARVNYEACVHERLPVTFLPEPAAWGMGSEAADAAANARLLVDALLGTGSRGTPHGAVAAAIQLARESRKPAVSIDVPSGVDATSGYVATPSILADLTVTFALPKAGLLIEPGRSQAGVVEVVEIGIPPDVLSLEAPQLLVADAAWTRSLLPDRPHYAHKGSVGRVLLVGGSAGMTGAMALACETALRSGAGYAVAAVPGSCVDPLEARVTEVVKRGMPETPARTLSASARDAVLAESVRADVVAIGPGLSRDPESEALVRDLVERIEGPLVLDADGLNAFEGRAIPHPHGPLVITPHYGEAARLAKQSVSEVSRDPVGWARRFADETGAIVAMKSVPMATAARGVPVILNGSGTPGMATAGAGDVLTGTISGFLAQGLDAVEAVAAGCFVHGLAGEIAARRRGVRGMIAGDIRDAIPAALMALESGALDGP